MAGEMSQFEVTKESYPLLFSLRDALKRRGIKSEPRAFDQYQGPYLRVPGVCKVWLDDGGDCLLIERRHLEFETKGSYFTRAATDKSVKHGVYFVEQAAKRIAEMRP